MVLTYLTNDIYNMLIQKEIFFLFFERYGTGSILSMSYRFYIF